MITSTGTYFINPKNKRRSIAGQSNAFAAFLRSLKVNGQGIHVTTSAQVITRAYKSNRFTLVAAWLYSKALKSSSSEIPTSLPLQHSLDILDLQPSTGANYLDVY